MLAAAGVPHEEWELVRRALLTSQYDSVDGFLAKYPEHSKLTKLNVAYWISFAESFDTLMSQGRPDNWYKALPLKALGDDPALGGGH